MLGARGFDADAARLDLQGRAQLSLHGLDVGPHLGGITDERAIDVAHLPAFLRDHALGFGEQLLAVGVLISRVGVGEVLADVAQAKRTQQGIDDGMGQGVGVRMAQQALFMGNLNAAQHQAAVWGPRVKIKALSNAEGCIHKRSLSLIKIGAPRKERRRKLTRFLASD